MLPWNRTQKAEQMGPLSIILKQVSYVSYFEYKTVYQKAIHILSSLT